MEDKLAFLRNYNRKERREWFFKNRKKLNFKSFWELTELLERTGGINVKTTVDAESRVTE